MPLSDLWHGNIYQRVTTMQQNMLQSNVTADEIVALGNRLISVKDGKPTATEEVATRAFLHMISNAKALSSQGIASVKLITLLEHAFHLSTSYGLYQEALRIYAHLTKLSPGSIANKQSVIISLSKCGYHERVLLLLSTPAEKEVFYKRHPEFIEDVIHHLSKDSHKVIQFLADIKDAQKLIEHLAIFIGDGQKDSYMLDLLKQTITNSGLAQKALTHLESSQSFKAACCLSQLLPLDLSTKELCVSYAQKAVTANKLQEAMDLMIKGFNSSVDEGDLTFCFTHFPIFTQAATQAGKPEKILSNLSNLLQHWQHRSDPPATKIACYTLAIQQGLLPQLATLNAKLWLIPLLQEYGKIHRPDQAHEELHCYLEHVASCATTLPDTAEMGQVITTALKIVDKKKVTTSLQTILAALLNPFPKEERLQQSITRFTHLLHSIDPKSAVTLLSKQLDRLVAQDMLSDNQALFFMARLLKTYQPKHPSIQPCLDLLGQKLDFLDYYIEKCTIKPLSLEFINKILLPTLYIYEAQKKLEGVADLLRKFLKHKHENIEVTKALHQLIQKYDPSHVIPAAEAPIATAAQDASDTAPIITIMLGPIESEEEDSDEEFYSSDSSPASSVFATSRSSPIPAQAPITDDDDSYVEVESSENKLLEQLQKEYSEVGELLSEVDMHVATLLDLPSRIDEYKQLSSITGLAINTLKNALYDQQTALAEATAQLQEATSKLSVITQALESRQAVPILNTSLDNMPELENYQDQIETFSKITLEAEKLIKELEALLPK